MTRIVQLTHFSTRRPVFGGQKRSAAIRAALENAGHSVSAVECFGWFEPLAEDDFCYDPAQSAWLGRYEDEAEIRFPAAITARPTFSSALAGRIGSLKPDLLWIEQPYLWPFQRDYLELWGDPLVVYSSHNIEWLVRNDIQVNRPRGKPHVVSRVKRVEIELIRAADLVVAVTKQEGRLFEQAGSRETLVFGNGADRPPAEQSPDGPSARQSFGIDGRTPILLMVSFDWEPNFQGLLKHVLDGPRDVSGTTPVILLVGAIARTVERANLPCDLRDRMILLGEVDDTQRRAAFAAADLVILPITAGRGSNLKTAEALLSPLPIVATRSAFRGFESLVDEPGVLLVEDTDYAGFQDAVASVIAGLGHAASAPRRSDRVIERCTWEGQSGQFLPAFEAWLSEALRPGFRT